MSELPDDELEKTRAALAPTLDATAAILPWVAEARTRRFDEALNERWIVTFKNLAETWSARHQYGDDAVRSAVFALYAIALETKDPDCLLLGEALATASDRLEHTPSAPRLLAALSATIESLSETEGLEHILFAERAQHFAKRLSDSLAAPMPDARSPALDKLFVSETGDRLVRMQEALDALPLDAYALKLEAEEMEQQAEQIDLWGVVHLVRELRRIIANGERPEQIDTPELYDALQDCLQRITLAVNAVDS
jgi:hypothetical protein